MLDLSFRNETSDKEFGEDFFKPVLEHASAVLELQKPITTSVTLVSEAKMKSLNKKYRHKDAVTDVLSFPTDTTTPNDDILEAGDIVICLSYARERAQAEKVAIKDHIRWMAVHGFLHLLGYDHEKSPEAEREMFDLEKKILE